MTEIIALRPLLPLLIPLFGAWVAWVLPASGFLARVRRGLHILVLLVTCVFLIVAGLRGSETLNLPFWGQLFELGDGLAFSLDLLAISFALLLSGALAVISLSMLTRPMERFDAVTSLGLVGSAIAVCLAGNLLTLCLAWVMMDLALFGIDLIRVPEESIPHGVRNVLTNLLSTSALVAAAGLLAIERGGTRLVGLALAGRPLQLLMAAALLRLSVYPLPGSLRRRWEAHLGSLATGSYLWLRLISLAGDTLPGVSWLMPFCGWTLLITALLASLSPDFATALPYLVLNGLAMIVCAPMIEPRTGIWVALAVAINLSFCLAVIRADVQVRPVGRWGRWMRLPSAIGLGSLVGWPLTLGFVAHWTFLKLCWTTGWRSFMLLATLSYLLASAPIWNRLRQVGHEVRERGRSPLAGVWVALGCVVLGAAALIALGIAPTLMQHPWPKLSGVLRPPTLLALLKGDIRQIGILLLTVLIVPILGGYALQRLWANAPRWLVRAADTLSALLELDWLYLAVEGVWARVRFLWDQAAIAVEQTLCLSWALLWCLMVTLLLLGK